MFILFSYSSDIVTDSSKYKHSLVFKIMEVFERTMTLDDHLLSNIHLKFLAQFLCSFPFMTATTIREKHERNTILLEVR